MKIRKHVSMLAATAAFATVATASADSVGDAPTFMADTQATPSMSIVVSASESTLPDVNDQLTASFTLDVDAAGFTAGNLHDLMLEMQTIESDTGLLDLLNGETRPRPLDDVAWDLFLPDMVSDAKSNSQESTVAATPGAIALLALAGCIGCLRHRAD